MATDNYLDRGDKPQQFAPPTTMNRILMKDEVLGNGLGYVLMHAVRLSSPATLASAQFLMRDNVYEHMLTLAERRSGHSHVDNGTRFRPWQWMNAEGRGRTVVGTHSPHDRLRLEFIPPVSMHTNPPSMDPDDVDDVETTIRALDNGFSSLIRYATGRSIPAIEVSYDFDLKTFILGGVADDEPFMIYAAPPESVVPFESEIRGRFQKFLQTWISRIRARDQELEVEFPQRALPEEFP
jgi:hypothetical protein